MAMVIKGMPRIFVLESGSLRVELVDPNPAASPEMVKQLYTDQYPELAAATIQGPITEKDRIVYKFAPKAGTKG